MYNLQRIYQDGHYKLQRIEDSNVKGTRGPHTKVRETTMYWRQ